MFLKIGHLLAKTSGKNSLQAVLVAPFVFLIFTVVTLTGYLSFYHSKQAVNEITGQLRNEIIHYVHLYLSKNLTELHQVNQLNATATELGLLDVTNPDFLKRYFWHQLQIFPTVHAIYFGNPQGGLVLVRREEDNTLVIDETVGFVSGEYHIYKTDAQGNQANFLKTLPVYDARLRPWYQSAQQSGKPTDVEPFMIHVRNLLGIAESYPVYNKEGILQGVFAADITSFQINDFLKQLKIAKRGYAFIIERSGLLVASSTAEPPLRIDTHTQKAKRFLATESQIPFIRQTVHYLHRHFRDFYQIEGNHQLNFTILGKRQYLQIAPLYNQNGINWLIVIVTPEADFMERINAHTRVTILLTFIALGFAILIGITTAQWIIQPILHLNRGAKALAAGNWQEVIVTDRQDEVGQLTYSFNQMAKQLQQSITTLRENEDRLVQFLEAIPVGIAMLDGKGMPYYLNRTGQHILGRDVFWKAAIEQISEIYQVYLAGTDQLYPVERQPIVRALRGESSTVDDAEIRRTGKVVPIEIWGTPIFDETGKVVYAMVAFQDITERKSVEIERLKFANQLLEFNKRLELEVALRTSILREREQTLRSIFNATTDAILMMELDGTIVTIINPKGESKYHVKISEMVGRCVYDFLPTEEVIQRKAIVERVVTQCTSVAQEVERSGRYFEANFCPVFDDNYQHVVRIATFSREITARKRAEDALRKSEERYRIVVEGQTDMICRYLPNGQLTFVNTAYSRFFKRSESELLGHSIFAFFSKAERAEIRQYLHSFSPIHALQTQEYVYAYMDSKKWYQWTTHAFFNEHHELSEFQSVGHDVTQLKLAEEAAEAANRAKNVFLTNMSHELRTPLNGILGFTQILLLNSSLTEEQREGLTVIRQSGEHLLLLINDILDIARIETGSLKLFPNDFRLPEFIDAIIELFIPKAKQTGLDFIYQQFSILPATVKVDEKRLRQVLLNLLSNAIKFTPQGSVTLAVEYSEQPLASDELASGRLYFYIKDTGIGIASEDFERIFLPFQQVHPRLATDGTGIGLPISKKLVSMMGGELRVISTVGRGSTFSFSVDVSHVSDSIVPILRENKLKPLTYPRSFRNCLSPQKQNFKILIVDEKWQDRTVLMNLLKPLGFNLFEATNRHEALHQALQLQPDVIFFGLTMSEVEDIECIRQLQHHSSLKETVIIALSAHANEAQRCMEAGSTVFLPKPIDANQILRILTSCCQLEELNSKTPVFSSNKVATTAGTKIEGPASEQAKKLYELVKIGDIQDIIIQTKELAKVNPHLHLFAEEVCQLAKGFKVRKLEEFVKQYIV